MDIRISVAVMAHPRRLDAALQLRDAYPDLKAHLALDPEPDGVPATLRTSLLAWKAIEDGVTHHLVLQDDAVLCRDFPARLHAAVAARRHDPIALFTDWGSRTSHVVRLAAASGASWAEAVDVVAPAQSLVLPADLARGFAEYCADPTGAGLDDAVALSRYLASRSATVYACVPNLVDHSCIPSLLGHDLLMGIRRSTCFVDDIGAWPGPWNSAAVSGLDVVPHLSTRQGGPICCLRQPGGEWRTEPTLDWLRARGFDRDELAARFAADLAALPSSDEVTRVASPVMIFDLWLTMVVYGRCQSTDSQRSADGHRADHTLAEHALATFVPGAMRRILAEPVTRILAEQIAPLLRGAIDYGRAATPDA
jgi:hypothetical protein